MQVDISADRSPAPQTLVQHSFIRRLLAFFVRLFERYTPGPYVLAVGAEHPNGSFSSNGIYGHEFLPGTVLFGAALLILV